MSSAGRRINNVGAQTLGVRRRHHINNVGARPLGVGRWRHINNVGARALGIGMPKINKNSCSCATHPWR